MTCEPRGRTFVESWSTLPEAMDDDTRSSDTHDVIGLPDLAAGGFSSWLSRTRNAQREKGTAGVPCGECIACCTSSYFIDIAPGESQTLARIPKELLFPAPGLPRGNVLLGYDESGRCPMLLDRACSIYEHRPQTCRSYDCRVFPAAGIEAGGRDKELIKRRVRRWRFSYPTEADRGEHLAVQAAATFLRRHADCFPDGFVPGNPAPAGCARRQGLRRVRRRRLTGRAALLGPVWISTSPQRSSRSWSASRPLGRASATSSSCRP